MKNDCSPSLKTTSGNIFLEAFSFIYYCQSHCNFGEIVFLLKALLQLIHVSRIQENISKSFKKYLLSVCYVNNIKLNLK